VTLIRLEGVSKRFGAAGPEMPAETPERPPTTYYDRMQEPEFLAPPGLALDGVNLLVRAGETMAVLGPSGCGKTTLLRVIAGLVPPDAGRVYFNDQDVTDLSPAERRIGMVFQNYALYPHMESRENIAFFFRIHHREEEIPERVRTVSQIMGVGFDLLLDRKPPQLSEGERQRVAIARCIAREPSVFLFDEPLSNLDAKLRVKTRAEIKRLLRRFHCTCLYVTHDQSEAVAMGDRIAVMRAGRIEQVGTFGELYDWPATAFVAGFLGSPPMNIWPAQADVDSVLIGPLRLPMPLLRRPPRAGTPILFGIRPEHLYPDDAGPIQLEVEVVEPHPSEHALLVHGRTAGYPAVAKLPLSAGVPRRQIIRLACAPADARLFDACTGERLP